MGCGFYQYSNGMALFTSNHPHPNVFRSPTIYRNIDFSLSHAENQVEDDDNGLGLRYNPPNEPQEKVRKAKRKSESRSKASWSRVRRRGEEMRE